MFDSKYLLFGISFGILVTYLFLYSPNVICKAVTPENVHTLNYKEGNKCYKFTTEETECKDE